MHLTRLTLMLCLFATTAFGAADLGAWHDGAPMPTARKGVNNAAVALDGRIYVVGGVAADGTVTSALEVYDPNADRWTTAAPHPLPLWRTMAAAVDGLLFTFGGYRTNAGYPFGPTQRVFAYDPVEDAWHERAAMPGARGSGVAVVLEGRVHVLGGGANYSLNTHEVYDPATDRWTSAPPLPTPRSALGAAVLDGRIYAAGGYQLLGQIVSQRALEVYDPRTDAWTPLADMPDTRHGTSAVAFDGRMLVFGGLPAPGTSRVLAYDPRVDAWTQLADMPTGATMAGAARVGDRVYVIGGGRTGLRPWTDGLPLNQVFVPPVEAFAPPMEAFAPPVEAFAPLT